MNQIKVSIIVPVYNVAQYLRRCLDSCIHQTMQEIEIIVVNDCSPDPKDAEIMREYEAQYPYKVRCIFHSKNKKLGAARNTGIQAAKGEFIYCLDSDDYIEPTLCQKMYDAIVAIGADMSVCDCERITKNGVTAYWESNGDFSSDDLTERIKSLKAHNAWLIMIKKSVIVNFNLFFPEELGFEDIQCILWYLAAKKIVRVKEMLYHYIMRDDSITQNYTLDTYKTNLKIMESRFQTNYFQGLDKEVKEIVVTYALRYALHWTNMLILYSNAGLWDYCRQLLNIEKAMGFDVNAIVYESACTKYIKNMFVFIKQNIERKDFCLQYSSYHNYQNDLYNLRLCDKRLQDYAGKRITIWGAGKRGERVCGMLKRLGVPVEMTDVNEKLHGKKIVFTTVVKPWSELRNETDVVFSSVVGRFEEIRDRIQKESPGIEVVDSDDLFRWSL